MKPNTKYGDHLPMRRAKFKDGGIVAHGAPIDGTLPPGQTTRKRPKVGDKDPNYKPGKKMRAATPRPRASTPKKSKKPNYPHRDYRGVMGVVDDAGG